MTNPTSTARVAALWMAHGAALGRLLRAHGKSTHAANLDAALEEISNILAAEIGRPVLAEAMDWASERLWDHPGIIQTTTGRH